MPGQIAAVDGRYVSGIERPQSPRVVPVVEMTAKPGEPVHGGEVASSRSIASIVPVHPKSRALTTDRR